MMRDKAIQPHALSITCRSFILVADLLLRAHKMYERAQQSDKKKEVKHDIG